MLNDRQMKALHFLKRNNFVLRDKLANHFCKNFTNIHQDRFTLIKTTHESTQTERVQGHCTALNPTQHNNNNNNKMIHGNFKYSPPPILLVKFPIPPEQLTCNNNNPSDANLH